MYLWNWNMGVSVIKIKYHTIIHGKRYQGGGIQSDFMAWKVSWCIIIAYIVRIYFDKKNEI